MVIFSKTLAALSNAIVVTGLTAILLFILLVQAMSAGLRWAKLHVVFQGDENEMNRSDYKMGRYRE